LYLVAFHLLALIAAATIAAPASPSTPDFVALKVAPFVVKVAE
jgi:hypothetical protein